MTIMPMLAQAAERLEMLQRTAEVPLMAMQAAERWQAQMAPMMGLVKECNRREEDMRRFVEGPINLALNFINASRTDFPIFKEPELKISAFADIDPCDDDEDQQRPNNPIGFRFPPNY